jgi:predicted ester cyclase
MGRKQSLRRATIRRIGSKEIASKVLTMKISLLLPITLVAASFLSCSTILSQTLSENKAVVLRSEAELWSKGNLAAADDLYSPEFVCHFVGGTEWRGIKGIKSAVMSHRTSFPDWHEKVEDIVAEGDRVAIRIRSTGTQRGEFAGIAPTGSNITIEEFHIYRLGGGKIIEQWGMPDVHSLLDQLSTPSAATK